MGLVRGGAERGRVGAGAQKPEGIERCPRLEGWPRNRLFLILSSERAVCTALGEKRDVAYEATTAPGQPLDRGQDRCISALLWVV